MYKIIVCLLIVLLNFSCNRNEELLKVKKNDVHECMIYSSGNSFNFFKQNDKFWKSSNISKDELIFIKFFEPVFIEKISVVQLKNIEFDNIEAIIVFSDKGTKGVFNPENIIIKDSVYFLLLKIEQTSDFWITNAYSDSGKFQIAFENLNKPVAISKIDFYKNDSVKLNISLQRSYDSKNILNPKNVNRILDYSNVQKSISFNKDFFLALVNDVFYFGIQNKSSKNNEFIYNVTSYSFETYSAEYSTFESKLTVSPKTISLSKIEDFRFDFEDDFFVDISSLDTTIIHDIKYATEDNFTHKKIYDCAECLLRYKAAKDLVAASDKFKTMGYRLKVFDCYRPLSAQYVLWEIMPNINYVANPEKGSIHNRGAAVDVTIVDKNGKDVDMGTPYDYFGVLAYSTNLNLPDTILQNRRLLWNVLNSYGFKEIKTEWWHLSHFSCLEFEISNTQLPCE